MLHITCNQALSAQDGVGWLLHQLFSPLFLVLLVNVPKILKGFKNTGNTSLKMYTILYESSSLKLQLDIFNNEVIILLLPSEFYNEIHNMHYDMCWINYNSENKLDSNSENRGFTDPGSKDKY